MSQSSAGQVMKAAKKMAAQLMASPEQRMLAQSVAGFFKERGLERHRALRDEARSTGRAPSFSREDHRAMGELGLLSVLVPEADGGMGLGMNEVVLVCEAAGRVLAPEPLIGSAVWATSVLVSCGSEGQKAAWLPRMMTGETVLAVADEDRGTRSRAGSVTRVEGGRLFADKVGVLAGGESDAFIVVGRGVTGHDGAWLVRRDLPGVEVRVLDRVDGFPVAEVRFDGVAISDEGAQPLPKLEGLQLARERATVALCAEMVGGMSAIFETTLAYLDERVQFGVKIGTFQALRHRAARLYIELELAQTAVLAAAQADSGDGADHFLRLVSLAKSRCSETYESVAAEGIQMHGGIGMTDEHIAGFFFKRARVAAQTLGTAAWHRDRWARLAGY